LTLPNIMSSLRIPLAFVFLWLLFADNTKGAIIVLIISALSDLEGFVARKTKQTSDFGAFYDPFCDKFFMIVVIFTVKLYFDLDFWKVFMLLFREFFVMIYMMSLVVMGVKNLTRVVKARIFGKIATTMQFISVFLLLVNSNLFDKSVMVTFVFCVFASLDYLLKLKKSFHTTK